MLKIAILSDAVIVKDEILQQSLWKKERVMEL